MPNPPKIVVSARIEEAVPLTALLIYFAGIFFNLGIFKLSGRLSVFCRILRGSFCRSRTNEPHLGYSAEFCRILQNAIFKVYSIKCISAEFCSNRNPVKRLKISVFKKLSPKIYLEGYPQLKIKPTAGFSVFSRDLSKFCRKIGILQNSAEFCRNAAHECSGGSQPALQYP